VQCVEATARTCDLSVKQALPLALGRPFGSCIDSFFLSWGAEKKESKTELLMYIIFNFFLEHKESCVPVCQYIYRDGLYRNIMV
jgi:Na+/phosphate symporter